MTLWKRQNSGEHKISDFQELWEREGGRDGEQSGFMAVKVLLDTAMMGIGHRTFVKT